MDKIIWKARNPRQATEKQTQDLTKSIDRFNLATPFVINKDNTIIGGHFRYNILKKKGIKIVDVRVPNRQLTNKEVEELNIRLNKNLGEWDFDSLANFDEDLLLDVGFESEELDRIFQLNDGEDNFDIDKEYEKIKKPKTKLGNLYQLGGHRLLCGDATKEEDVERLLGGAEQNYVLRVLLIIWPGDCIVTILIT